MFIKKRGYEEEYQGRPAIFLIPTSKLYKLEPGSSHKTIFDGIGAFLKENYGDSWSYRDGTKGVCYGMPDGDYTEFEISFVGKHRIPVLKRFLVEIAQRIKEDSIYIKTGEESWKIRPPTSK